MKILEKTAACVFAVAVYFIILYGVFYTSILSPQFFHGEIDAYKLEEKRQVEPGELKNAADHLVDYLKDRKESPQLQISWQNDECNYFNERELEHLKEIEGIFRFLDRMWLWCFALGILCLLFLWKRKATKECFKGILLIQAAFIVILLILLVWMAVDLRGCINCLHRWFFTNELWILNPAKDKLIWLFPSKLFWDAAVRLGIAAGVLTATTGGISASYLVRAKNRNKLL